jgi:outer membrane protein assembly factor BamB
MKLIQACVAGAALAYCGTAGAENWPQWRGPHFNGSSDERNLPDKWTKDSALWSANLPGPGAATPVIWGGRVFISTTDAETKTLHALCFDRETGRELWDKKAAEGFRHDEMSNFASPSPVADADRVFFFYGTGDLVAYDHAGKELWSRNIVRDFGEFAFNWTFSASPTLYEGKLYLEVLQRNVPVRGRGRGDGPIDSFLLAMDPATGSNIWRVVRPSDPAVRMESHEAYTTPIPFEYQGRKEILIAGSDCLTGHDAATGRELWRWGTYNPTRNSSWRLVPSPVAGAGVVLACAPKGDPIYAIKAGGNGALDSSAVAWTSDQRVVSSDVPTPLFYDGDFFVLNEGKKCLSRVDPATGAPKWTVSLPGFAKFEASPTGADGKIYLMNFAGNVVVLDAAKGGIISSVTMGESGDDMTRSTISVSSGELFIRTNQKLFCIGKK